MDNQKNTLKKKPVVDQNKCIGCGLCAIIAPGTFVMQDGKSTVVDNPVDPPEKIQEAIESCPVSAIS